MTIKEWKDAGLAYEVVWDSVYTMPNFDNICKYMFRCSSANASELPTDVRAGSTAMVFDNGSLSAVKQLNKDMNGAVWNDLM